MAGIARSGVVVQVGDVRLAGGAAETGVGRDKRMPRAYASLVDRSWSGRAGSAAGSGGSEARERWPAYASGSEYCRPNRVRT